MTEQKITTMDKAACKALAAATEEALAAVAERFGVTVTAAGGKYDPAVGTFSPKVEYALADAGRREWEQGCRLVSSFNYAPLEDSDSIGIDLDERNVDLARERCGMFLMIGDSCEA